MVWDERGRPASWQCLTAELSWQNARLSRDNAGLCRQIQKQTRTEESQSRVLQFLSSPLGIKTRERRSLEKIARMEQEARELRAQGERFFSDRVTLARQVRRVSSSLSKAEQEAKGTKADLTWHSRQAGLQRQEDEERITTLRNERDRMTLKVKRLVEEKEKRALEPGAAAGPAALQGPETSSRLATYYERKSSDSALEKEASELRRQLRDRDERLGQQAARLHKAEMGLIGAEAEVQYYRELVEAVSKSPASSS